MRQVADSLNQTFKPHVPYLIEQQCQNNCRRHAEDNTVNADQKRVADQAKKIRIRQKTDKMLQAHPVASEKSFCRLKIHEGDETAVHRSIPKDYIE